jgi:uncharacterized membrane protein YfcA
VEILLVVAGFLVGTAVGATAIGAGLLAVPFLMFLGIRPTEAVGTALAINLATRLVAAWQHSRQRTVHYGWVGAIALGSLPSAILTTILLGLLKAQMSVESLDTTVAKVVGAMLVVMSLIGFVSEFTAHRQKLNKPSLKLGDGWIGKALAAFVGLFTGASVTFTGIGAGGIVVAFLAACTNLAPSSVVGTAVFHGVLLTAVSLFGHAWVGELNLLVAAMFLVGSLPGAIFGSRISLLVPKRALKLTLLTIVLASGVRALI